VKSHAKASSAGSNSATGRNSATRTSTSLRALPALLALAIGALFLFPALASAALEHAPRGIFGSAAQPTFFETGATAMAVDQTTGDGQNGKPHDFSPLVRNEKCGGRAKKQGKPGPRG